MVSRLHNDIQDIDNGKYVPPSPLDRKKSVIFLRFEFEISATIPKSMSTKKYYLFFPST